MPSEVIWSYLFFGAVLATGLLAAFLRGDSPRARGVEKLLVFGPLFYAAPLTAFGVEHFTQTKSIASLIPQWIPWHLFWTYAVGAGFVLGGFSLVARILALLSARMLALTFFLFVVLMDLPAWAANPSDRFGITLALRELSFSGGALAFAASLAGPARGSGTAIAAAMARYFVAVPVLFFSFEQFMHGSYVPGIPLRLVTPDYVFGHAVWTYLAALAYAVAGILLVAGKHTRAAATWLGAAVLVLVLIVYVPIAVVERGSLKGFNFLADTLMFCGAVLLVAGAMPRIHSLGRASQQN
jgi:uncharacterized membrane protein YphA (DoxX/SURF4 family)